MKVEVQRTFKKIFKAKYQNGRICVLAYWLLSRGQIQKILSDNAEWFKAKQAGVHTTQQVEVQPRRDTLPTERQAARECSHKKSEQISDDVLDGRVVVVDGRYFPVKPSLITKSRLENDCLYIFEDSYIEKNTRIRAIKAFLKKYAKECLSDKISVIGCELSLCPTKIEFKELTDGWLRCDEAARRIICLDYRVCQLPDSLQRTVIAHAFAHFKHQNHDRAFHAFTDDYIPNCLDNELQLRSFDFLRGI